MAPVRREASCVRFDCLCAWRRLRQKREDLAVQGLLFLATLVIAGLTTAIEVRAADAANGKRLAQEHCAHCHIVAPNGRNEVADSPPFDVIGRKYCFDANTLVRVIVGPHRKMNFSPQLPEAADIGAYIATLRQ
jgi:mono/diheme cytochrome c family protein